MEGEKTHAPSGAVTSRTTTLLAVLAGAPVVASYSLSASPDALRRERRMTGGNWSSVLAFVFIAVVSSPAAAQNAGSTGLKPTSHIKSVTAITEVFGDGQKTTAAAIEYDQAIDTTKLTASTFSVAGRTITKVYANTSAARVPRGVNGRYAIIDLSPADEAASIVPAMGGPGGPGGPEGPGRSMGPGGPGGPAGPGPTARNDSAAAQTYQSLGHADRRRDHDSR